MFDQQRFVPLGAIPIRGLQATIRPRSFIRWGADGLAFATAEGQVFLLQSSLVSGGAFGTVRESWASGQP